MTCKLNRYQPKVNSISSCSKISNKPKQVSDKSPISGTHFFSSSRYLFELENKFHSRVPSLNNYERIHLENKLLSSNALENKSFIYSKNFRNTPEKKKRQISPCANAKLFEFIKFKNNEKLKEVSQSSIFKRNLKENHLNSSKFEDKFEIDLKLKSLKSSLNQARGDLLATLSPFRTPINAHSSSTSPSKITRKISDGLNTAVKATFKNKNEPFRSYLYQISNYSEDINIESISSKKPFSMNMSQKHKFEKETVVSNTKKNSLTQRDIQFTENKVKRTFTKSPLLSKSLLLKIKPDTNYDYSLREIPQGDKLICKAIQINDCCHIRTPSQNYRRDDIFNNSDHYKPGLYRQFKRPSEISNHYLVQNSASKESKKQTQFEAIQNLNKKIIDKARRILPM